MDEGAAPQGRDMDEGAELMRVAKTAAGAFVAANPSVADAYDDLVGDAALGAVRAAQRYDASGGAPLGAFAYQRAAGAIIDGIRERSLVSRTELRRGVRIADLPAHRQMPGSWEALAQDSHVQPVEVADGPDRLVERTEEMRQLRLAIEALPAPLSEVIVRNFLGGETLTAIAVDRQISLSQVSQERQRALHLLRAALGVAWHGRSAELSGGVRARKQQTDFMNRLTAARVVA